MSRNAPLLTLNRVFGWWLACFSPLLFAGEMPRLSTSTPASARARVVMVEDPAATVAYKPVPERVHALVQQGITNFTRKANPAAAWQSLVSTQDIIGIKVFSLPGPQVGTRVSVVEGVVEGLLAAKVPGNHIIVWDRRLSDLRRAGFTELEQRYGIRVAGSMDSGWATNAFYESSLLGQLVYGDYEFQRDGETAGRKSFVTKLLTSNVTRIINISPMLTHNTAGVCGNLYSLTLGSVDNTIRFEGDPGKLSTAVPEIYALPAIGDRVVLNIVDGLICQYLGQRIEHLHYSIALNQLRFSTDPVALDVLSIEEIESQRAPAVGSRTNRVQQLFHNAALLELGVADPNRIDVQTVPATK